MGAASGNSRGLAKLEGRVPRLPTRRRTEEAMPSAEFSYINPLPLARRVFWRILLLYSLVDNLFINTLYRSFVSRPRPNAAALSWSHLSCAKPLRYDWTSETMLKTNTVNI